MDVVDEGLKPEDHRRGNSFDFSEMSVFVNEQFDMGVVVLGCDGYLLGNKS
jgi:hypothetical protein